MGLKTTLRDFLSRMLTRKSPDPGDSFIEWELTSMSFQLDWYMEVEAGIHQLERDRLLRLSSSTLGETS